MQSVSYAKSINSSISESSCPPDEFVEVVGVLTGTEEILKIAAYTCKITGEIQALDPDEEAVLLSEQFEESYVDFGDKIKIYKKILNGDRELIFEIFKKWGSILSEYQNRSQFTNSDEVILNTNLIIDEAEYLLSFKLIHHRILGTAFSNKHFLEFKDFKFEPSLPLQPTNREMLILLKLGGVKYLPLYTEQLKFVVKDQLFEVKEKDEIDYLFGDNFDIKETEGHIQIYGRKTSISFKKSILHESEIVSTTRSPPLTPPTLSTQSNYNNIEITVDTDYSTTEVEFYRNYYSEVGPTQPELIDLSCDGNICKDDNVEGGTSYYYKARINKSGRTSLFSNTVNGMPTTEYKFDYINYDPAVSAYSQRSVTGRVLNVFTDLPVDLSDVEVILSIPDLGIVYPSVAIDNNGEFEIPYLASTQIGLHEIRVEARIGENSIFREFEQEVVEADDAGRDLTIQSVDINSNVISRSSSISGTIVLKNDGDDTESNGRINFELLSRDGVRKESSTINFSLGSGSTRNQSFNIPITNETLSGDYQLKIEVTNSEGLDENILGNVQYRNIYVYENALSSPTYKLSYFEFDTVGSSVSTSAGPVLLNNIDPSGDVEFIFNSNSTGDINANSGMGEYWESPGQDLIIVPVFSNYSTGKVEVYLGTPTSALTDKSTVIVPKGSSGELIIFSPSGNQTSKNDLSFIFNEKESKLDTLLSNDEAVGGNLKLIFEADEDESIANYPGWLRLKDGDTYYIKEIEVGVKPFHKVRYARESGIIKEEELTDINGNVLDPVRGMPFKIQGYLDNVGEYYEDIILYNEVTNSDYSYIRYDYIDYKVAVGDSIFYQFEWNTAGLPAGLYLSKIIALHNNVDNLTLVNESLQASYNINLIDPPPFDLDLFTNKNSYGLGEDIKIRATAERLGQALTDAKITAEIEHPDGRIETLLLKYDDANKIYEATTRANLGGNYYIDAFAERKYYIPQSTSEIAQVNVNLSAVYENSGTRLFEREVVEIRTSPVGGLQGLALDLTASNDVFDFKDFVSSSIWDNPTKQISNSVNPTIIGLTNLGDENSLTTFNEMSLGYVVYEAKKEGAFTGAFENATLIDKKGNTILTTVTSPINLEGVKQDAYLSITSNSDSVSAGILDTLDIIVTNSYQTFASNLELGFNPEQIEIIKVEEGSALSNYNSDSTIFVNTVNAGKISIGVTRSNTSEAIDIGSGVLGSVIYKPLTEGQSQFNFEKAELISPIDNNSLPVVSNNRTISISPFPDALKKRIVISNLTSSLGPKNEVRIAILTNNVEGLGSIATEVKYDSSKVDFISVTKGNYFNQDANLLFNNNPDSQYVTIGITNLSDNQNTVSTNSDTLLVLTYKVKAAGDSQISLSRTALFDSAGDEIPIVEIDNLNINFEELHMGSSIIPELKFTPPISFANEVEEIELTIVVDSVQNVYSFAGDIKYDPANLAYIGITEGNFFNQNDSAQTSLISFDDSQNGILTLGVSRLGEDNGVSTNSEKVIASIKFEQIGSDSSRVRFSKSGLLYSDGETEIIHTTKSSKVGRLDDGFAQTPTLLAPISNDLVSIGAIEYSWSDHTFNDSYIFQLSKSDDFSENLIDTILTTNFIQLDNLVEDNFYWRVRALNDYGQSDWASTSFFTTIFEPEKVVLSLPINGSISNNLKPNIIWEPTQNATSYQVQFSRNPEFNYLLVDSLNIDTTLFYIADSLEFLTEYFWRVRAENFGKTGDWSEVWSFTTIVQAPDEVELMEPAESANQVSIAPTFRWKHALRSTEYLLELSGSSDFNTVLIDTVVSDSSIIFVDQTLSNEQEYFWRVRASNIGGSGDWSEERSFTTIPATPEAITVLSPEQNAQQVGLLPVFIWKENKESDSYEFQLSDVSTFETLIVEAASIVDTTYVLEDSLGNSINYYWRVRGQNGGINGTWSTVSAFTTIIEAPEMVILETPADNQESVPVTPVLKWRSSDRASEYIVVVSKDSSFTQIERDTVVTDTVVALSQSLQNETNHYWRVKASNVGGESAWSETWKFATFPIKPDVINLSAPSNGSNKLTIYPELKWYKNAKTNSYNIQLSIHEGFNENVIDTSGIVDTTLNTNFALLHDQVYYWRARGKNEAGYNDWSEVWSFTTIVQAPDEVELMEPAESANQVSIAPTFRWKHTPRATEYVLELSGSSDFSTVLIDTVISDSSIIFVDQILSNEQEYFWRVRASNIGGSGDWSEERSFITIPATPEAITVLSPEQNAQQEGLLPEFIWKENKESDSYEFQLSDVSTFETLIVEAASIVDTTYVLEDSLGNSINYYWRVRGQNGGINGTWSTVSAFTTIIEAPEMVILETPADNQELVPLTPVLQWRRSARATEYRIQITSDSLFSDLRVDSVTTDTSITLINPLKNDKIYYWRIMASNLGGQSKWSSLQTFNTIIKNPERVSLRSPLNHSLGTSRQPAFKWDSLEVVEKYGLQLGTDSLFTGILIDTVGLINTEYYLVDSLNYLTKYYWRVRGGNEAGFGDWSDTWSFTTIIDKPTKVKLISPSDSSDSVPVQPEIKWSLSPEAVGYNINISSDSVFKELVVDTTITTVDTVFVLTEVLRQSKKYFLRVRGFNDAGYSDWSDIIQFSTRVLTSNESEDLPVEFNLSQNYPNPFNPITQINYTLPKISYVRLEIINLIGQSIGLLVDEKRPAGYHTVLFNASNLSSGVYFYRIKARDFVQTKQMLLIK